jgi:hypothetical protein|tara:strand:+ start:908 stop:1753 length:846 start_codon:yes stop_codon:yes gene_type:complete
MLNNLYVDMTQEEKALQQLRAILLQSDRQKMENLEETLDTPEKLEEKMRPIMTKQMTYLRDNFKHEFGGTVDKIVESKLEQSKEQLLDVIYPVLGQMITKYIRFQFQALKDRIDNQLKHAFSTKGLFRLFKARLLGVDSSEMILQGSDKPIIHQIFIVTQHSGLLAGEYAPTAIIDQDMIVGMLTAIKAFAKDALAQNDDLDTINYDNYRIEIQNFHQYYAAIIISGSLSVVENERLSDEINNFATASLNNIDFDIIDTDVTDEISNRLKDKFQDFTFEER